MSLASLRRKLLPVLHEDDWFLFVRKPAGLALASTEASALLGKGGLLEVYELPSDQSGVLAFAKTSQAQRHLRTGIETGSAQSSFVAVVHGHLKRRHEVVSGSIVKVGKGRFVADRKATGRDVPTTRIETVARGEDRAMVRCRLTGLDDRQVRAHLSAAHLRLAGEADLRSSPRRRDPLPLMLHLEEIRFHHPGLKRALSVRTPAPAEYKDALGGEARPSEAGGVLGLRLSAALARRLPCFVDEQTNAFRLLHGEADQAGGLAAELYGDVLVLQVLQGKFRAEKESDLLRGIARWYQKLLGVRAVYVKHFVKDRSRIPAGGETGGPLFDPRPLVGEPVEPQFGIREHGLTFLVRAYDGYSTGLFLDQRENRRRVRELASGRRVLNLFAYTCGFSVAAAAGGAAQTVSVDTSVKHLEWGKENFRANSLALEPHVFIRDDALNYFKRARRQGSSFDLAIVDPPSFARLKKPRRVFTVAKDLRGLLAEVMALLAPDGIVLVSTNYREATRRWLREQIELAAAPRKVSPVSTPDLPLDFAGDPDYAKSLIVRVS